MKELDSIPEYGWQNAESTHAHGYLWPTLKKAVEQEEGQINRSGPLRVFDAGCGNGFVAGRLLEQGYRVAGCDASEMGISRAQDQYPEGSFEVASVYDDLAKRFGRDWDLVVSSEVVEHLYSPRCFVNNIFQLLRPGGAFILSTPYHGYLKNLALALTGKLDNHFTVLWDGGHIKFWSYKTLAILLEEAGFVVTRFYGAGRFPFLWKSMVIVARKPAEQ